LYSLTSSARVKKKFCRDGTKFFVTRLKGVKSADACYTKTDQPPRQSKMSSRKSKDNRSFGDAADDSSDLALDPIVRRLKVAYDDVASEPFPEHLLDLLQKLEDAEKKG